MKFLIQTIDGKIRHDFSFTLIEAIRFKRWYYLDDEYKYIRTTKTRPTFKNKYIPVGSVRFVLNYLRDYFDLVPKPRNVPESLFEFAGRKIFNGTHETNRDQRYFAKSNDLIKPAIDPGFTHPDTYIPTGRYQFSEFITFKSEWRAFVYKQELVGLQNYSGDFTIFPDVSRIQEMIQDFADEAPIAYTIDVYVNEHGTFIMEVHDFFSCGLYGFADLNILPNMLAGWFNQYTREGSGKND